MKIVSAAEAIANLRHNPMGVWCGNEADTPGPNLNYAGNRLHAAFPKLKVLPTFEIEPGSSVFAMGSCFAREIEAAFGRQGFEVLSFNEDVFNAIDFESDAVWGASNYINRYTTASMLREIERVLGIRPLDPQDMLYGPEDRLTDLHFSPSCSPGDISLVQRRRDITLQVGQGLRRADIVVLTLGLTEAWFDKASQNYINAPLELLHLRRNADRFEMHNLDFETNLRNLERIHELLTADNPDRKIIITVSPVPLQATFNDRDIIVANMDSKATLRAVACEFILRHPSVLYFPSFEIVSYSDPQAAWKGDRRHVTTEMVDFIMSTFRDAHGLTSTEAFHLDLAGLPESRIGLDCVMADGLEIAGNEVALHPFDRQGGEDAKITFLNIPLPAVASFSSGVQLSSRACEPVEFGVSIADLAGNVISEQSTVVEPGGSGELDLDFDRNIDGPVSVSIFTRMAGATGSSAYAWARFLSPRLTGAAVEAV